MIVAAEPELCQKCNFYLKKRAKKFFLMFWSVRIIQTGKTYANEIHVVPDQTAPIKSKIRLFLMSSLIRDYLSYDIVSGSEITPCNKIDKPLVIYRMTSITTLLT